MPQFSPNLRQTQLLPSPFSLLTRPALDPSSSAKICVAQSCVAKTRVAKIRKQGGNPKARSLFLFWELVAAVIDMVLKSHAREGRLPILGSNLNDFLIYCPGAESDVWKSKEDLLSAANLIGMGSFGSVYKGVITISDATEVPIAVKVLNVQRRGSTKSFVKERKLMLSSSRGR